MVFFPQALIEHVVNTSINAYIPVTGALVFLFFKIKKKQKFKSWKRATLDLGIYKVEWEQNEDQLLQELWEKNLKLEEEVKFLKKRYENLSVSMIFIVIGLLLVHYFSGLAKRLKLVAKSADQPNESLTSAEKPLVEETVVEVKEESPI